MTWIEAATATLPDESVVAITFGEVAVAVAKADGAWHALDAWCTHEECPLAHGWVEGSAIRCACHGALFDLVSGDALEGPAVDPVRVYPTRVVGDRVEVDLPG